MCASEVDDLERLKRLKMEELKKQLEEQERRERKEQLLRLILTPAARSRLTNIRLSRPDVASQVEDYLIRLFSAGRIKRPLTDDELKVIISSIVGTRREIRIRRK